LEDEERNLVPSPRGALVEASGADSLLVKIRPAWQAKSLIERVKRLLPVDPSSACQRLFNAAVHDLREKILIAGIDLARDAAAASKLPPVTKNEDILDSYSTSNILHLSYHMGLLSRPEWRQICRAYEIRRDLEHEDDEYEAGVADCVYIFQVCVESVLARDPIELLRISDVREIIESPANVVLSTEFVQEYEKAPKVRQKEIMQFLVNLALSPSKVDLVRQNAVEAIRNFQTFTKDPVKIDLAREFTDRQKRKPLNLEEAKVAWAGGFFPYLKQAVVEVFFEESHKYLVRVGHDWTHHSAHGPLLDDLEDVGGLISCRPGPRRKLVLWMTLCYLGEPGFYGGQGFNRPVFYSNSAAPRIVRLFKSAGPTIREDLESAATDPRVRAARTNSYIARRFEKLLDLTEPNNTISDLSG